MNLEIVRRPALIVRAADAIDVSYVVLLARETGMDLVIRSGGHSLARFSALYVFIRYRITTLRIPA